MADQKIYHAPGIDVQKMGKDLEQWFQSRELETQVLPGVGGVTVQSRMKKQWLLRGSLALTVTITPQGENLLVQAGAAKWAVHAVSGVAAAIVFWPLLAIPAYGAYKQKELIDETWAFIDRYIAAGGNMPIPSPVTVSAPAVAPAHTARITCPSCGQSVAEGAKFCPNCGAKLALECAECGAPVAPGAKFCSNCGKPVGTSA